VSGIQRTHWPAVAAALAAGVVAASYVGKMPAALPVFQEELGLSLIAVSWLVSMFNLIGLTAALPFGLVADRVGAFRFCLAGLLVLALGGAGGSAATTTGWILASRVLEGAGLIAISVGMPALIVAASAPRARSITLGMWGAYMPAGMSLGLALSPLALAAVGWRGYWLALAGATLVCLAWLLAERRRFAGVGRARPRSAREVRAALAHPVPWFYAAAFAGYTLSFHGVMVWLPTYVQQTRLAGLTGGALLAAAVMVVNVIGNLYGARLIHRGVARGTLMAAGFLAGGVVVVALFAEGFAPETRFAAALLYSLLVGVIPAAVMSGVARYAGSAAEVGTLQGLVVQWSNVGIFGGPPLVAAAVTWGGNWQAALAVPLVASVAGAALSALLARRERASPRGAPPVRLAKPRGGH